jgi:hypothetical protein
MAARNSVIGGTSALFGSAVICALFLSGCGSTRYSADYNGFNGAFADSSNHQMLLNLARLDQHDPSYFLQFGQISVQYQLSSSINGVVNNTVPQSTLHVPILSEVGTLSAGANTTPQFTFIPVTDDKVAQQLLLPLPPEDLYTLFQQGLPVDQLLRLMGERFEVQLPNQTAITTYANAPARGPTSSYIVFLKICGIARELQIDGHLKLRIKEEYTPVADGWTWSANEERSSGGGKGGDSGPATENVSDEPSAKDLLDAQEKGFVYQKQDGKWGLFKRNEIANFYLEGDCSDTFNRLSQEKGYNEGVSLKNILSVLSLQGFSVEGNVVDTANPGSRLILRSFLSVLAAAAQEQTDFEAAITEHGAGVHIPDREMRPILKLKWTTDQPLLAPLLAVDYRGETYQITDPVSDKVNESTSWNRDVFRLLTELSGQASIDTSKFPLPTSLQVVP